MNDIPDHAHRDRTQLIHADSWQRQIFKAKLNGGNQWHLWYNRKKVKTSNIILIYLKAIMKYKNEPESIKKFPILGKISAFEVRIWLIVISIIEMKKRKCRKRRYIIIIWELKRREEHIHKNKINYRGWE